MYIKYSATRDVFRVGGGLGDLGDGPSLWPLALGPGGAAVIAVQSASEVASAIQTAIDTVTNALPTWAGGQVLTADQLASIQAQAAQDIHRAATDPNTGVTNTALEQQAVAQMKAETAAVAAQAQVSAVASDTTSLLSPAGIPWWEWAVGAVVVVFGVVLLIKIVE
jgi:hypothetical protein